MEYTVILTDEIDGKIHATVPGLPECDVEAKTRNEALDIVRETITTIIGRSEIVHLEVPIGPKSGSLHHETPWEWFGTFKNDLNWEKLFNKIENERNCVKDN